MQHCQSIIIYSYSINIATINETSLYLSDTNFGLGNISNNNNIASPKKNKDINKDSDYDILLVNESERWQELFIEAIPIFYSCLGVHNFDEAIDIINKFRFRLIFLSRPFNSKHHTRLLLKELILVDPGIPVVLVNASYEDISIITNIKERYPNIREVMFKFDKGESESDRFVSKINQILKKYLY